MSGVRECGCREFVTQCEHYNGRVLRYRAHGVSIVVELKDGDSSQLSVCHSVFTAHRAYRRYRVVLMGEEACIR